MSRRPTHRRSLLVFSIHPQGPSTNAKRTLDFDKGNYSDGLSRYSCLRPWTLFVWKPFPCREVKVAVSASQLLEEAHQNVGIAEVRPAFETPKSYS